MCAAAMPQRKHKKFEFERSAVGCFADDPGHDRHRGSGYAVEECKEIAPILGREGLCERAVFEFTSQKGADTGTREPYEVVALALKFEQENVAKQLTDRARIEIGAIGRAAGTAQAVPVRMKGLGGGMLH